MEILFMPPIRVKLFFTFSNITPRVVRSRILYKCDGCNVIAYDETKRHSKVRISEHLGILHLTFKMIKIDKNASKQ